MSPGRRSLCDVRRPHRPGRDGRARGAARASRCAPGTRPTGPARRGDDRRLIAPDAGPYLVSTAAVALENTHNFGGGTVQPLEHLTEALGGCAGTPASAAPGRRPAVERPRRHRRRRWPTTARCSTPSASASPRAWVRRSARCWSARAERIARARVQRKRLGGGWRQAGRARRGRRLRARPPRWPGSPTTTPRPGRSPAAVADAAPGGGRPGGRRDQHRGRRHRCNRPRTIVAARPRTPASGCRRLGSRTSAR